MPHADEAGGLAREVPGAEAPAGEPPGAEPPAGEVSNAAAPGPAPADSDVTLSRRTFILGAAALAAAGAAAGGAALLLTSSGQPSAPGTPAPGGVVPPPAGILPIPSGATEEPIESGPPAGKGRVARENRLHGTKSWELPLKGKGNAEGYASDVSVAAGEELRFHVSSSLPQVTITLYRLGWYGGQGARVVDRWKNLSIRTQLPLTADAQSGLIRAPWDAAVRASTPDTWVSGLYLAVLSPVGGSPQYMSFVVRETSPTAPILFVSSTTTHQAYNPWGGKSLYPDESTGAPTVSGDTNAVTVSWDRPYEDYRGGGLVLRWEYPFVRWLESHAYDVGYAADLDLERHPELLAQRELIVFAGHPEYWSVPMRTNLESAIAAGTNVAFFAANEVYWRVRFEAGVGGQYRTVTCYRRAEIDPLAATDPVHTTTRWRDAPAPRPECLLCGQMYGHMVLTPGDFVCALPDHWVFAGTGMQAGDRIANLVGQEYDRCWTGPSLLPPGTQILASSPVNPNLGHLVSIYGPPPPGEPWPPVHNSTIYTASSGATVFSAGTMQWSWGLDGWGTPDFEGVRTPVDPRVGRITANILDRLAGEPG